MKTQTKNRLYKLFAPFCGYSGYHRVATMNSMLTMGILFENVRKGKKDVIKEIHSKNDQLIHGIDESNGDTAIIIACGNADLKTVKLLEELGADMNYTIGRPLPDKAGRKLIENKGKNGFLCAAAAGKKDIIKYLHSKNDQLIHSVDENGRTAITIACGKADLETVKLLEELGADVNYTLKPGPLEIHTEFESSMGIFTYKGKNGFLCAAEGGKKDIIKYLHSKNDKFIHSKDKYCIHNCVYRC
jgi:hypothetical protein